MNADSINKVGLIGLNLIDKDTPSTYLTSGDVATPRNLPELLKTKASTMFASANVVATNNVYYKSGVRENPRFISSDVVDTTTYNWPSNSGWTVSASSATTSALNAFAKDSTTTDWTSEAAPSTSVPQWVSIKYPTHVSLKYFTIQCGTVDNAPKAFKIYGSLDGGSNYSGAEITSYTDIAWGSAGEIKRFDIYTSGTPLYNAFKIAITDTQGGSSSTLTIAELKLFTKHNDQSSWGTVLPTSTDSINFTNVLQVPDASTNPILTILDTLRICYNLLDDPAKLTAYYGSGTTVNKYSMNTSFAYDTSVTIKSSDSANAIKSIFPSGTLDPTKTSFLAVKRLLKAYEYIIHVYIAMTMEPGTGTSLTPITDLILNQLNDDNNSLNDNVNGYRNIQNQITAATTAYNNGLGRIDGLDIQLEDLKDEVVKEKQQKTTNSNILNKNTIVYYVFLLLFIILVCVLLYALQNKEDEKSKLYVGGALATSIVAMIVIYFLNMTYLKEGFTPISASTSTLIDGINRYLSDTLNISLMTDKYSRYNDVLHVVNKEIDRYDVINHQLKLEAVGTNDVQVYDYRNARILQYRVYLLLQIIIILSVATIIYLYTGENILLFGIVLLLILFMIYLYIMNTHGLVHTDAKKIYWGQPSIIN
jgi:hypothetical protein